MKCNPNKTSLVLKTTQTICLTVLLINFPSIVQSIDFHVCDCESNSDVDCVVGNDNSDGSLVNPFQSIVQANSVFNSQSAGDSIQLCNGGSWLIQSNLRWVNGFCRDDNKCTITDYDAPWASGNEQKPILNFQNGSDGFNLADSGNAEHEEGYLIENLDLRGSNDGRGVFLANDVDDVILSNLTITNFRLGVYLGSSNDCNISDSACDGQNERITLRDSTVTFNSTQGWLGGSSGTKLINNYFSDNGTRAIFDHNVYISGSADQVTQGILVSGNQLYRNTLDQDGACSSVSLVVHGEHNNLVIENNIIWEDIGNALPGCWGIAVDGGYSEAESFTNVLIQSNSIINVGRVGVGLGSCENCVVENNLISNHQDLPVRAILAPDRNLAANDLPLDNLTVRNNSIYIDNLSAGTAITVGTMGDNHLIVSNAIFYTGNSNSFNCFDVDLPSSNYLDIDNNLCYHPNATNAEWSNQSGNLSQWQFSSGFSFNSVEANPGYESPENDMLWAENQDAAIVGTGHPTLSSSLDYNNSERDTAPDIGAYEFHGEDVIFINGFE